ncbi:SH2 domain-containing protein 1A-like isoform X2 [Osmerus eperlanus]|uniref:SH2 domain-containing protein 1A-like isoform X2 n=1 Tax=Osmerus eperlanus TaxID=29151 RepID=UPI002E0E792F
MASQSNGGLNLHDDMMESALIRSIYYGKISKEHTERLLERHGHEGSFLLRDSESVQGVYCLCVRQTPYVHTYRICHSSEGWALQVATGKRQQHFRTLDRLIESYRRGVASDVITPLTHPLDKTQLQDIRPTTGVVQYGI